MPGFKAFLSAAAFLAAAFAFFEASCADLESLPVKVVLFPYKQATISSQVTAKVLECKFKEGQRFSSNDELLRLDDRSYKQAFLKAQASASEAAASLKFSEANYKRAKDTFAKNAIGLQDLEQSALDRDTAEAKLQFAKASLEQAKLDLEACSVRVPFNGRLSKRIANENETVPSGQPLLEVIDDSRLLAVLHLPSQLRKDVKIGDEISIKVDETGEVRKGSVFEISGKIEYESRSFELKALVENEDQALSAGMSGVMLQGRR